MDWSHWLSFSLSLSLALSRSRALFCLSTFFLHCLSLNLCLSLALSLLFSLLIFLFSLTLTFWTGVFLCSPHRQDAAAIMKCLDILSMPLLLETVSQLCGNTTTTTKKKTHQGMGMKFQWWFSLIRIHWTHIQVWKMHICFTYRRGICPALD